MVNAGYLKFAGHFACDNDFDGSIYYSFCLLIWIIESVNHVNTTQSTYITTATTTTKPQPQASGGRLYEFSLSMSLHLNLSQSKSIHIGSNHNWICISFDLHQLTPTY